MKFSFIISLFLLCSCLTAQVKRDQLNNKYGQTKDTISFKSDIQKVQYCLGNYYNQRQTGFIIAVIGSSVALTSQLALNNSPQAKKTGTIIGGAVAIIGTIIIFDSDKWMKRASISISPTSIKITF